MGSPAGNAGKENYAVTVEYEEQKKKVGDDDASSWRWLTRIAWGPAEKVDLYARIGAANLKVDTRDFDTFNGEASAAYGLGIRYATPLSTKHNLLIMGDFQYLGFTSKGEMTMERSDIHGDYSDKWVNKYWWGEYQVSALVVWQRSIWIPYGGLGLTWVDGKVDKNYFQNGYHLKTETSEFSEMAIAEFVLGMDFPLRGTARFSWEARYGGGDISYFMGLNELWK